MNKAMHFALLFVIISVSWPFGLCNNKILESPRVTNWGEWGPWEKCPTGKFVVGMRLKSERISLSKTGDNTALNGVQLFCDSPGHHSVDGKKFITSSYANWGSWGTKYICPGDGKSRGVVTGFQLRSETNRGSFLGFFHDDTAANNMRVYCDGHRTRLEGDGTYRGSWTTSQHCKENQGVCGLRTQVEYSQGWVDDTALNNIQMECCDYP